MLKPLHAITSASVAALITISAPASAQSYPIDCAILLCLAGGWPASTPCALARAEFIRRVTPSPVEPPLQIWRCPMAASHSSEPTGLPDVFDALYEYEPQQYTPWLAISSEDDEPSVAQAVLEFDQETDWQDLLYLVQQRADIDISDPAFDFVRSIRVIDIDYRVWIHESSDGDQNCREGRRRMRQGVYGPQGEFRWEAFDRDDPDYPRADWLPFQIRMEQRCPLGSFRGVGIEWRDHEGNHGYEVVRY